jgi:hypothetical protein
LPNRFVKADGDIAPELEPMSNPQPLACCLLWDITVTCDPQIHRRAHASRSRGAAHEAIFMVQPAQERDGDHLRVFGTAMTGGRELIRVGHRLWNPRSQAGVWTTSIVVGHPFTKGAPEMRLVHRD